MTSLKDLKIPNIDRDPEQARKLIEKTLKENDERLWKLTQQLEEAVQLLGTISTMEMRMRFILGIKK